MWGTSGRCSFKGRLPETGFGSFFYSTRQITAVFDTRPNAIIVLGDEAGLELSTLGAAKRLCSKPPPKPGWGNKSVLRTLAPSVPPCSGRYDRQVGMIQRFTTAHAEETRPATAHFSAAAGERERERKRESRSTHALTGSLLTRLRWNSGKGCACAGRSVAALRV